MPIIGIDLGTTNSVIACYKDNEVKVIPNRLGEHLTPSIVSVDENNQIFVGEIAKQRLLTHPQNTAAVFKRHMGSKKEYQLGDKKFLPEELSSLVLRSLKEDAQVYLNEKVEEAVISVPAYFNDTQRKATKRAAELAGLKVERLINEPTAAAIAYGLHERQEHTKFLVFDLGGGTFDVSILELFKNVMEVRGVAGDNYLGGEDFTELLVQLFIEAKGIDEKELEYKEKAAIKKQAEVAKRNFCNEKSATMKVKLKEDILEHTITLEEYEKAAQPLLTRLRRPIERALSDASIKVKSIDAVVMVGGATRLPMIRSFVGKLFGRLPSVHIDPDEAIAIGACIQAAMKARDASIKEVVLTDVCPYTLGTNVSIERSGGYFESGHFCPIIERGTIIPVSRVERLYTIHEGQREINIQILQGESRMARDNIYLGEVSLIVPPGPAGSEAVDVRYTYDVNGLLEVEAKVVSTGVSKHLVIEKNPGSMSEEEIKERFEALSYMKIHPREKEENRLLLAKGERLYEESVGNVRVMIDQMMNKFEEVLNKQDEKAVDEAAKEFKEFLQQVEESQQF